MKTILLKDWKPKEGYVWFKVGKSKDWLIRFASIHKGAFEIGTTYLSHAIKRYPEARISINTIKPPTK